MKRSPGLLSVAAIYLVPMVAIAALLVWIAVFAPCRSLRWLPVLQQPARCVDLGVLRGRP